MKKHPGPQGPRRPQVAVRISEAGIAAVDDLARGAGMLKSNGEPNRSEMVRRLLSLALADPTIRRKAAKP